ncbi:hypothetical protein HVA01_23910 [Halovibrio variabilis]|uniref:Uncharacterized protein n=1 Tax=Halovibrio variabilis TaxID=31910 RepID=A0A511UQ80_9GAMM|nr:hypothetical protein HVA01_23910 [Halovibrio variabilis]
MGEPLEPLILRLGLLAGVGQRSDQFSLYFAAFPFGDHRYSLMVSQAPLSERLAANKVALKALISLRVALKTTLKFFHVTYVIKPANAPCRDV